jgi:hypothetical protein
MSIFSGSRYEKAPVYTFTHPSQGLVSLFGRRKIFTAPNDGEFKYYEFKDGDTIDYLAYQELGNPAYWWVIMDCNTRFTTPWDIKVGDIIKIPTTETLRRGLNAL